MRLCRDTYFLPCDPSGTVQYQYNAWQFQSTLCPRNPLIYQLKDTTKNVFFILRDYLRHVWITRSRLLANKLPKTCIKKHDYIDGNHTPGLFKHQTRPMWFTLTLNDFGIKCIDTHNALHLLNILKSQHKKEIDWSGRLYCGIRLTWN